MHIFDIFLRRYEKKNGDRFGAGSDDQKHERKTWLWVSDLALGKKRCAKQVTYAQLGVLRRMQIGFLQHRVVQLTLCLFSRMPNAKIKHSPDPHMQPLPLFYLNHLFNINLFWDKFNYVNYTIIMLQVQVPQQVLLSLHINSRLITFFKQKKFHSLNKLYDEQQLSVILFAFDVRFLCVFRFRWGNKMIPEYRSECSVSLLQRNDCPRNGNKGYCVTVFIIVWR